MNRAFKLCACLFILIICTGCKVRVKADISDYTDTPITISGLTEEEFTVTPGELAELECVRLSASGKTAKAGEVSAVGPLLDTFLAQYDKKPGDFKVISFIARDKYKVELYGEYLTDYQVVLSLCDGNKPLSEDMRPMRIFIPGTESNMWEYAVIRIELK